MKENNLKSGAVLGLQMAAFEDSMDLLDSILKEMVGVKVEGFDIKELIGQDLTQLKDVLFKIISSKLVKAALWKCMESCTYQEAGTAAGLRINKATFESEKTRGDFFPVAGEVTAYNLAPFFKNLTLPSSVQEKLDLLGASQKPETG
jgi:hypothetical protein